MKIVILDGSAKENSLAKSVCNVLKRILGNTSHEADIITLADIQIASCLGCFGCWLKTPGICVIPDAGSSIAKTVIQSDLMITISPITFGGYSYDLKKVLDRLIPIISPFFMKIDGEVHHKPRYARYPISVSIGLLPEKNEEMMQTYQQLVTRNALNLHTTTCLSSILFHTQSVEEIDLELTTLLQRAGALDDTNSTIANWQSKT